MRRSLRNAIALTVAGLVLGPISSSVSASTTVPTPESVIGWKPCADYKMATYEQVADYYRKLDRASDRMRLFDVGKSTEGRPILLAAISTPENLENLSRYKAISRRLALASGLSARSAQALAREGKTIAWVDFGIHAIETAPPQEAPNFAYRLVTDDSPELRAIRENVITVVVPNLNPDGGTQVARWYREHLRERWELSLPELYQKYAGHDNNRDWYMFNLEESRAIARQLYQEWLPQVIHNQHQSGPYPSRIFIPPFEDPVNPNIPPEVTRGVNLVGDAMGRRLTSEGKVGAVSRISFDMWWNGGMRSAPYYHNMIGILTETSHNSPTPRFNDPDQFPAKFDNGESTRIPSVSYPDPYLGGEWHMNQSCGYVTSTSLALLDLAAEKRTDWLYGAYRMGASAIAAGAEETYVVSAAQRDLPTAVKLVQTLQRGGVAVEQATSAFTAGSKSYPAGSYLIRGAQAFLPHIRDMLNKQVYPERRACDSCPLDEPYDITGYTLSMQMGVAVDKYAARVSATTRSLSGLAPMPGGSVSTAPGEAFALDPAVNDTFTAVNEVLAAGFSAVRIKQNLATSSGEWPAGTFLVAKSSASERLLRRLSRELGLQIGVVGQIPADATPVRKKRMAVYQAWGSGYYDEGWTRYVLDNFRFSYTRLRDTEIRAGNLRDKYDVIVLPDATYRSMRDGNAAGSMPPEYTGGMTSSGVDNLGSFVKAGGTLVAMDSATQLPIQAFGLPVKDVTIGVSESELYIPGSVLNIRVDPSTPLGYGMPSEGHGFFIGSPAFELTSSSARAAVTYPNDGLLASGWILGENILRNKVAVAQVPYGEGAVALLGFRTQHRAQAHGTYKLLFNALYL